MQSSLKEHHTVGTVKASEGVCNRGFYSSEGKVIIRTRRQELRVTYQRVAAKPWPEGVSGLGVTGLWDFSENISCLL